MEYQKAKTEDKGSKNGNKGQGSSLLLLSSVFGCLYARHLILFFRSLGMLTEK